MVGVLVGEREGGAKSVRGLDVGVWNEFALDTGYLTLGGGRSGVDVLNRVVSDGVLEYERDWDDGYDEQNDQDQGELELGAVKDALRAFGLVLWFGFQVSIP